MSDAIDLSLDGVEQMPLRRFTENAYLNYSMYVIIIEPCRILVMV